MTRRSVTQKVCIYSREFQRVKVFVTAEVEAGKVMGLHVTCDQVGTTMRGLLHNWAAGANKLLELGVGITELAALWAWHEYEPKGMTDNPKLPFARSIVDYVVRWAVGVEQGESR
jgi:ribonucleoside-diphosphate reductase alpha chain